MSINLNVSGPSICIPVGWGPKCSPIVLHLEKIMNTFYVNLARLCFCGNPELHLSLFIRELVNQEPPSPLEYGVQCNRGPWALGVCLMGCGSSVWLP